MIFVMNVGENKNYGLRKRYSGCWSFKKSPRRKPSLSFWLPFPLPLLLLPILSFWLPFPLPLLLLLRLDFEPVLLFFEPFEFLDFLEATAVGENDDVGGKELGN